MRVEIDPADRSTDVVRQRRHAREREIVAASDTYRHQAKLMDCANGCFDTLVSFQEGGFRAAADGCNVTGVENTDIQRMITEAIPNGAEPGERGAEGRWSFGGSRASMIELHACVIRQTEQRDFATFRRPGANSGGETAYG
jgi:hypothetical protein